MLLMALNRWSEAETFKDRASINLCFLVASALTSYGMLWQASASGNVLFCTV